MVGSAHPTTRNRTVTHMREVVSHAELDEEFIEWTRIE